MPLSSWFWILYVIGTLFGFAWSYRAEPAARPWNGGFFLLAWVLIGILGYAFFGSVSKG